MLLIPLMLSIPEYFIGELENKIIDQLELKDNRAASLSMMNIGVNLVQVVSLFAASVLTKSVGVLLFAGYLSLHVLLQCF